MITVATFDPAKVVFAAGLKTLSGFAPGTFITIKRNGNGFEKKRGSDGDVERINKNANDFEVEVKFLQTSSANDILSALYATDTSTNAGVIALTIKDGLGTTVFSAPQAWISKDPDVEFADDTQARTWTFQTGKAALFVGGNN